MSSFMFRSFRVESLLVKCSKDWSEQVVLPIVICLGFAVWYHFAVALRTCLAYFSM